MSKRFVFEPSIGGKLFLSFLSMAFLVAAVGISSGRQTAELEESLQQLTEELIPVLTDVEALSRAVMEMSSEVLNAGVSATGTPVDSRFRTHHQMVVIASEGMINGTIASLDMLLVERYHDEWMLARQKVGDLKNLASTYLSRDKPPDELTDFEALENVEDHLHGCSLRRMTRSSD